MCPRVEAEADGVTRDVVVAEEKTRGGSWRRNKWSSECDDKEAVAEGEVNESRYRPLQDELVASCLSVESSRVERTSFGIAVDAGHWAGRGRARLERFAEGSRSRSKSRGQESGRMEKRPKQVGR